MNKPELIFVAGCNAAGKSTFIQTRLNETAYRIIIANDDFQKDITSETSF